jgi:hypothetical protein
MSATHESKAMVVELRPEVHAALEELAREENRPMGEIVADALQRYRKEKFWARARLSVERLKADPVAWQGYLDELAMREGLAGELLNPAAPYFSPEDDDDVDEDHAQAYGL